MDGAVRLSHNGFNVHVGVSSFRPLKRYICKEIIKVKATG